MGIGVIRLPKPKYAIGQKVFSKVRRRSSSEPCWAEPGSSFNVVRVHQRGDTFVYDCEAYDFYEFEEDELMPVREKAAELKEQARDMVERWG